jgi:hypothetical protein
MTSSITLSWIWTPVVLLSIGNATKIIDGSVSIVRLTRAVNRNTHTHVVGPASCSSEAASGCWQVCMVVEENYEQECW